MAVGVFYLIVALQGYLTLVVGNAITGNKIKAGHIKSNKHSVVRSGFFSKNIPRRPFLPRISEKTMPLASKLRSSEANSDNRQTSEINVDDSRPQIPKRVQTSPKSPRNRFLVGNFAPVREEHQNVEATVVFGEIPRDLFGGQYIRNGPNPVLDMNEKPYHWFGTFFSSSRSFIL